MNRFSIENFAGKLIFQGSQDGLSYTNIYTVGYEIHEGWNYYTFDAGKEPSYRYYRFYGSAAGSCLVGEIALRGVEVIDNNSNTYSSCPIELTLNSDAPIVLSKSAVSYQALKTPLLK